MLLVVVVPTVRVPAACGQGLSSDVFSRGVLVFRHWNGNFNGDGDRGVGRGRRRNSHGDGDGGEDGDGAGRTGSEGG